MFLSNGKSAGRRPRLKIDMDRRRNYHGCILDPSRKVPRTIALSAWVCVASIATAPGASELRFTDATKASGIDFTMTSGRTPSREILEVNGGGVAMFDYDRDGDLDLFFANGATMDAPERGPGSRLYANAGDGTFVDVTEKVGIRLHRWAMGAAVGDYDDDGDDDLYVTCFGRNVLLRNDCAGAESCRFSDVTAEAGVGDGRWGTSAAFGDLDADGDLDLYVVNYLEFDPEKPPDRTGILFQGVPVMAGPAGLTPQRDVLYENLGDGKFRDITKESGCLPDPPGYGLGVVIFDADGDGRLDIFVGNDSTENFLFRNFGGRKFKNIGVVSGIASNYDGGNQATMGIALGDVDGNGRPDVFTTNFSSDTNTLHLNLGKGGFDDRTSQFGLAMISRPFLSWGAGFYDFDSDGDEDLFVASGHVYPETAKHKMDSDYEQQLLLFERHGRRFRRHAETGGIFAERYAGRSTAYGDLDDDGDVDIVMTTLNGKVRIFLNDSPLRDVIVVEPRRRTGGRHVPGSVVELGVGDRVQRRWIGGGSYQSVDAPVAYFAPGVVGPETGPKLRVRWPDGEVTDHDAVPANRKLVVERGATAHRAEVLRNRVQRR